MSLKKKMIDKLSNTWVDRVIGLFYASMELGAMSAFHQDLGLQLIKTIRKEDRFLMCRHRRGLFV